MRRKISMLSFKELQRRIEKKKYFFVQSFTAEARSYTTRCKLQYTAEERSYITLQTSPGVCTQKSGLWRAASYKEKLKILAIFLYKL